MLDETKLSDLFFNHEHPEYDRLWSLVKDGRNQPTQDESYTAMTKDAMQFANEYPEFGKNGGWYLADFFARL